MRMEWGKCRADTRSSHKQHAHHIALDTEREGRVPHPIRPRAEPRLDTQLARPPWPPAILHRHLAHVHLASRRVRLVEQASVLPPRPRNDRRRWPCPRTTEGATPRAHLRARGPVSAGRWSAARAEEDARPSSTCAGCSRRVTARRGGPAAPPGPGGEPPGWRTPSAARPPIFPPDLDLRHHPWVSCRYPASLTPDGAERLGSSDSSSAAGRRLTAPMGYFEGGVVREQPPAGDIVSPRRPGRALWGWGGQGVAGGAGSPTVQVLPTKLGWARGL